ncbi:hypothetical protein GGR50DRAFT_673520 [Xylaria sp. CBS 124048]|nr:hypothetical protein GGR50DRAFT_673520 [Xylaria sp. CBS 124048]
MDRSGYGPSPAHARHARQPIRMPPAMAGNYARIDTQANVYQRRPPSSSSVSSSVGVNDTFDAILASPASSRTSFDSWQSVSRNPDGYQRPAPIKQYRRRKEGELFAALPEEVLTLILQRLRESHMKPGSLSCATCMMRDLCSIAMSAKKFVRVARVALYEHIQLIGADSPQGLKKRFKIGFGARLVLLRRTLRIQPAIAILVRTLKAPAIPQGVPMEAYQSLLASVIMACPNLESLVGPHQTFDFSFNRLFHALSTREQLREMHWTLMAPQPPSQGQGRMPNYAASSSTSNLNRRDAPRDLRPEQSEDFRELHMNWANLTTLSIHCLPGATLTPLTLLPDVLAEIPSLQHLHLFHLPPRAFNDTNLLSLPALHTLTMSCLPGVTSDGLSSFARRRSSRALRKLTLRHLDVDSLPTIAQVLSHLGSLETFALVQTHAPLLPDGEVIWLFPYLASRSVKKLHWDIPNIEAPANSADVMLAKSIAARGFPALHSLRTPSDPDGIFQALCRPLEKIDMSTERARGLIAQAGSSHVKSPPETPTSPRTPRTPGNENSKSPYGQNFPSDVQLAPTRICTNLARSRLEAQQRLEAARTEPRFTFNLVNERGQLVETQKLAGYIGEVGSPINYCVSPDEGAVDENGGLMEIADFLGDGGEDLRDVSREGCTGRWNMNTYNSAVSDKKERERWWHTERGRWRPIEL